MKILSSNQIKALDAHTIKNEPISSIDLMERASQTFVHWFIEQFPKWRDPIHIVCGQGNNGGDGLAIARLLFEKGYEVQVIICKITKSPSPDFSINLERLQQIKDCPIVEFIPGNPLPKLESSCMIIDAIFGSGLNREVDGKLGDFISYLNSINGSKVSVDIPSGLFCDQHSNGVIFKADYCFSFEFPKLAFLFPENQNYVGEWTSKSIQLDQEFIQSAKSNFHLIDNQTIKSFLQKRAKYSHKGTFGHALIIAGAYGKVGAAILAAKACLRSGAGLVTIHSPKCAYQILQIGFPEAMTSVDNHEYCISNVELSDKYKSIGVGCGIGVNELTQNALKKLIEIAQAPMVLDADALNIISQNKDWISQLPKGSILTPHPKEFERLFGAFNNDFERNEFQRNIAKKLGLFIILKGANTVIACPNGDCYFNSTGNPGMATGGSGDVLTGILTGLLAQGYSAFEVCILGVYLHGLAGDIASEITQQEALLASDIIENIGKAFKQIKSIQT